MVDLTMLEARLAAQEAQVVGVRPGCAKQVVWAGGVRKQPVSLVYVHGFSASPQEVRPLPDLVAEALGANLFYTRLDGHGQDGAAMGRARLSAWYDDVSEALEIGRALGDEVIVMGCSTGCTLLTQALSQSDAARAQIAGIVHLSPNFGLRNRVAATLLRMPAVRRWGQYVVGKEQKFDPISPEHAQFWTVQYDTRAVFTMDDAVRDALASPIGYIDTPAYFAFAQTDKIVDPKKTRHVMRRWGGPVTEDILIQGPKDDKDGHVMAGDIFSPEQTEPLAARIINWIDAL